MVESYHIDRTKQSPSRTKSHVSHDHETWKLQQEIDHLRRKLRRRARDRRSPPSSLSDGSRGSRDRLYRYRSRIPSNESYSVSSHQDKLEKDRNRHEKGSSHCGMGNDAMSKSPFVRRINKARLPHQFSQPTFTIYNGRIDLVEHVSHFN